MIRLFQFLGLGLLLLMALAAASWLVDDTGDQRLMLETLPAIEGRDAVTLGGSIGNGIRYPQMCVDGADYYWNAQDFFEVAAIADLILDRPSPPRYWLVAAAPTAQSYDNGTPASERGARRREIYRLLFRNGRFGLIGRDWRQFLVTAFTPALGYDAWGGRFHQLLHQAGLAEAPPPPIDWAARDLLTVDPALAKPEAEAFVQRQSKHLGRVAYYDSSVARRSAAALVRLNQRIRARGGTMILVITPMTEPVRTATEETMGQRVREFDAMVARLAGEGVVISDHWRDPAFAHRYELFADNQHLNGAGAAAFSRSLARELRGRGILPPGTCEGPEGVGMTAFPATAGHEKVDDVR
jgi:hypothetical protein